MVTSLQTEIGGFEKVAPYLKDPLVLVGFFLFLSFLFVRYLLKAKIVPPLPKTGGYKILRTILLYGFIIGILLIVFGFVLKYKELPFRPVGLGSPPPNEIGKAESIMVTGFVVDSAGNGIESALVKVEDLPTVNPVQTATSGKFIIKDPAGRPGDLIWLVVTKEGYGERREQYQLNGDQKQITLYKRK